MVVGPQVCLLGKLLHRLIYNFGYFDPPNQGQQLLLTYKRAQSIMTARNLLYTGKLSTGTAGAGGID